jgi:hypothetical protein
MTIEKLKADAAYRLLLMLEFDDLLPFISEQFRSKTVTMISFFTLNILILLFLVGLGLWEVSRGSNSWSLILQQIGLGTLLAFTIGIILHEGIHGLAYKITGAPRIKFGGNLKQFYFYAVADRYILGRQSFLFVGLAPFVVITLGLIMALFLTPSHLKWLFLGVLFMHTGACAGDFALVSFYETNRKFHEMLTFDEVEKKISYFYVKD